MSRFRHYHQLDLMDCGPTCLRMVARHYGRHYSLETLRRRSFVSRKGVSMLGISDAAESIGLRSTGVRTSVDKLIDAAPFPCILHWNHNHFVVLYGIKHNKFKIADPASQCLSYTRKDFERCWTNSSGPSGEMCGTVLLLEPTPEFYEAKGEAVGRSWRGLTHYARYLLPYRKQFVQLGLGMLLGSLLQLVFPFMTQAMVDVGIGERNIGFITMILIAQL